MNVTVKKYIITFFIILHRHKTFTKCQKLQFHETKKPLKNFATA